MNVFFRNQLTQILRSKETAAEESKNNYILQLENTNLKRRLHYNSEMPQVFQVHTHTLIDPYHPSPSPPLPHPLSLTLSLAPSPFPPLPRPSPSPPLPHPLSLTLSQNLQDMNAKRVEKFSSLVTQCAECHRRVFPVVNTCLDNIVQGSTAVDATHVSCRN